MGRLEPVIFSLTKSRISVLVAAIISLGTVSAAQADPDAWGARAQAIGGAGAAWGDESFAAFFNPARLTQHSSGRFNLGLSGQGQIHQFTPIKNVVVENAYISDQFRRDNVDTSYRNVLGQAIGANLLIAPSLWNLSAGVTTFLPVSQVAYLDTGEPLIPEYVLYRARQQRPRIHAGLAVEPITGLSVGAGMQIGFSVTSRATVFLQSGANHPSTMRFIASMKPKASPYGGIFYTSKEQVFTSGVVFRMPLKSSNYLDLQSSARAFGNSFVGLDFNFSGTSAFFYDPMSLEVGSSVLYTSQTRLIAQVDYEVWKDFQAPAVEVLDPRTSGCGSANCGINISPGLALKYPLRNIWVPRIGHEVYFGESNRYTTRAGYSYRQGIFSALPTGAGNYLDPDKHIVSLGFGIKFQNLLGHAIPWGVDVYGQYQSLVKQVIRKTPGDELGAGSGDLKIGAPGYETGGKIYGGGATLTFAL